MEVYPLDDQFRRTEVVDRFESCIWTERYSAFGDFQLLLPSDSGMKRLLSKGTFLGMNKSRRVMVVENVQDKDDSEGRSMLTISGRSLESSFTKRSTRSTGVTLSALDDGFEMSGTPFEIAINLYIALVYNNIAIPGDNLPYLQSYISSMYRTDTIPMPSTPITTVIGNGQFYDELKKLLDAYGLGFRLYRGPDNSKLYFNVYAGSDRTSSQVTLPAVVFSPGMDNLSEATELSSIETEYNIAYVLGKDRSMVVYAVGVDEPISGFDRKVLTVEARDIAGTDAAAVARLEQVGREELSKYRPLQAIDGELSQSSKYVYDVDYSLGDLVELRNAEGLTSRMRVTEQIFVDDAQGERSYPTLATDVFITAGSWAAWDTSGVWDTAVGTWAEQPE